MNETQISISGETLQVLGNRALSTQFYEQTKDYFVMIANLADGNPYTPFINKLKYAFEQGISPEQVKLNWATVVAKNPEKMDFMRVALEKTTAFQARLNAPKLQAEQPELQAGKNQYVLTQNNRAA